jgi:hypothetical protein
MAMIVALASAVARFINFAPGEMTDWRESVETVGGWSAHGSHSEPCVSNAFDRT